MFFKKPKKIILTIVIITCIALAAAILHIVFLQKDNKNGAAHTKKQSVEEPDKAVEKTELSTGVMTLHNMNDIDRTVLDSEHVKNILLIGQDRRHSEDKTKTTRADTIMLCSINAETGEISLTSIMRDLYVPIEGHGNSKINAAYAYGGMDLLDATIESAFGITIDANIEVDFDGFLSAASILAPMEIELTEAEAEYMNTRSLNGSLLEEQTEWDLHEGNNLLDEDQLLKYVRMRYVGNSDYERTERQRRFMKLAFEKCKESDVFTLIDFARNVLPNITTDLSKKEILGYIYTAFAKGFSMGETLRIPIEGSFSAQYINGASVLVPNLEQNQEALRTFLYGAGQAEQTQASKEEEMTLAEAEIITTPTPTPTPTPIVTRGPRTIESVEITPVMPVYAGEFIWIDEMAIFYSDGISKIYKKDEIYAEDSKVRVKTGIAHPGENTAYVTYHGKTYEVTVTAEDKPAVPVKTETGE